jgi:hypothetical protein
MSATGSLDWTYKGMRTLILETNLAKISVLLEKGSDIFEAIYKPLDVDVIWHSPSGYKSPATRVEKISQQQDEFADNYGGGWNDVFPNYGFASSNLGTKFGAHGESSLLPWTCRNVKSTGGRVVAQLEYRCIRYPLRAVKTLTLEGSKFVVSEDLINIGEQEIQFAWAQHIAYGEPFVSQDLQIDIPGIRALSHDYAMSHERIQSGVEFNWPMAPGIDGHKVDLSKIPDRNQRVQEDFPIIELRAPEYKLYNPKLDLGVALRWNSAFPYLWYWLNWGILDYPYFGRGHTLALEPSSTTKTTGLADQIANGTALRLQVGEKLHGEIEMNLFEKSRTSTQ